MNKNGISLVIYIALLLLSAALGYQLASDSDDSGSQHKLDAVFELITNEYVDDITVDSLVEMTIPAMMKNLDPHSSYVPADQVERVNRDLESTFFGIGVQFQLMSDSVCVVEVISGGPAESAGVRAGDRIIRADSIALTGDSITNERIQKTLRGEKDTPVLVTVKRSNSKEPLQFEIIRGEIPSVSIDAAYIIDGNIGYVRIDRFAANTYAEFLQAMNSLHTKGATQYILDLRSNGGGLLEQGILVANEFLSPGHKIVEVKGRVHARNAQWLADGMGVFTDEPLVVLMDEFSASASEIVAGAIQDNDRGLIVGRRSFGKGLVQRMIELPDSSQVRLTVQRYYTPSGRSIQKDFTRGKVTNYETEVYDRYANGEVFSADSVKVDTTKIFHTIYGRTVYGGGGILPDVFVPSDTSDVTSYYITVSNKGLLNKFAYEYVDLNREDLQQAKNVKELLAKLPPAGVLLQSFTRYAANNGVPQRWYYINISSKLIVTQLRALIARDILNMSAYYEIFNASDPAVSEAVKQLRLGIDDTLGEAIDKSKNKANGSN